MNHLKLKSLGFILFGLVAILASWIVYTFQLSLDTFMCVKDGIAVYKGVPILYFIFPGVLFFAGVGLLYRGIKIFQLSTEEVLHFSKYQKVFWLLILILPSIAILYIKLQPSFYESCSQGRVPIVSEL